MSAGDIDYGLTGYEPELGGITQAEVFSGWFGLAWVALLGHDGWWPRRAHARQPLRTAQTSRPGRFVHESAV
jgi:hypothetical protein